MSSFISPWDRISPPSEGRNRTNTNTLKKKKKPTHIKWKTNILSQHFLVRLRYLCSSDTDIWGNDLWRRGLWHRRAWGIFPLLAFSCQSACYADWIHEGADQGIYLIEHHLLVPPRQGGLWVVGKARHCAGAVCAQSTWRPNYCLRARVSFRIQHTFASRQDFSWTHDPSSYPPKFLQWEACTPPKVILTPVPIPVILI